MTHASSQQPVTPATPRRIAVIGAGAGGLSAARHLIQAGHDVTVYEMGSRIGGLWVLDNDNGRSAAYSSLHINSEPKVTHYAGYPFPEGSPLFPSHREITAYLESFATDTGVRDRIRFNTRVTRISPAPGEPGAGWVVELEGQGPAQFDAVVVAPGHQATPAHPEFAGDFGGEYLHSAAYRDPDPFRGKRVLVVGLGNSGLDIAADLAPVAARTVVAVRSPVLIMPRMVLGVPSARILGRLNKPYVPWIVQRQFMRLIGRVFHGRPEQWGLRTPEKRTHPASSPTFMAHVAYRKITIRPGVERVEGRTVTFTDGSSEEVEVMIAATGYEIDLSFLAPEVSPVVGRRVDLYQRVVHPDWPGCYFVGFFNVSGGANISMMDVQSEWIAALVDGRVSLPTPAEMRAGIEAEKRFLARRFPQAARYGLELDPVRYRKAIARELRRAPQRPPARQLPSADAAR